MFKVGKIVFPSAVFFASVFQTANVVHATEGKEAEQFRVFDPEKDWYFLLLNTATRDISELIAKQPGSLKSYKEKIEVFWGLTFDWLGEFFWRSCKENLTDHYRLREEMVLVENRLAEICIEEMNKFNGCFGKIIMVPGRITQAFKEEQKEGIMLQNIKSWVCRVQEKARPVDELEVKSLLSQIESGDFFADAFRRVLVYESADACVLLRFFGGRVPFSHSQMFYGAKTFELFEAQKLFQRFSKQKLGKIRNRIKALLGNENTMLTIALQKTPADNKSVKEVREFFSDMKKKLETIQESVEKELSNERHYTDPFYWEIEPFIDEKEGQKILDELDERKEEEKKEEEVASFRQSIEYIKYKSNKDLQPEQFIKPLFEESSNKNLRIPMHSRSCLELEFMH